MAGGELPPLTLVLGGARSGKSLYAEGLASATGDAVYLATAEARDDEMALRIGHHQARRGTHWRTIEEPREIAGVLMRESAPGCAVLIDCLTLWLSNLMLAKRDIGLDTEILLTALANLPGPVVLVSNEVGMGLVPETKLGRAFRDAQGTLNRRIAEAADRVVFVAAGLPLILKDTPK